MSEEHKELAPGEADPAAETRDAPERFDEDGLPLDRPPTLDDVRGNAGSGRTIAIGCTGGRHRSVTVAERVARHLADRDEIAVRTVHRDVELD